MGNKVLAECSFKEFVNSQFFDDYYSSDRDGRDVFCGDGAKIVLCTEDCGYGEYLHSFYKRSPSGKWMKKYDFSDQQLADDAIVYLMGNSLNGDADALLFEIGSADFEIVLTKDMISSLRWAYEDGVDGYFPDFEVSHDNY